MRKQLLFFKVLAKSLICGLLLLSCTYADSMSDLVPYREFSVSVGPLKIPFKGKTNCDDQLIQDLLSHVKRYTNGLNNIKVVNPKFIYMGLPPIQDTTHKNYSIEEWTVQTNDNNIIKLKIITATDLKEETDFSVLKIG